MKHHQIISHPYRPARPVYYVKHERLANPTADVICVTVLAVILLLAGYMHVSMGL